MEDHWKTKMARFIEEFRIIESSISETKLDFTNFCEFIAEPAFESLGEELKQYGMSAKIEKIKEKSITLFIYFPKSNIEDFYFTIYLPENAVELSLRKQTGDVKQRKSSADVLDTPFLNGAMPTSRVRTAARALKPQRILTPALLG